MTAEELDKFKARLKSLETYLLRSEFESRLMHCHIRHGRPPEARLMQELIAIWKELRKMAR
jgi:hypothetical protein